ncbi:MAG: deoxyribonuclease V [Bradymonadia bacterium]
MIALLDVDYRKSNAVAAAVVFRDWGDEDLVLEGTTTIDSVEDYQPGRFYERELPCLLAIWERLELNSATKERRVGVSVRNEDDRRSGRALPRIHTVIVDGHVWLDEAKSPGLGAHLWDALENRVCVVGVAKGAFRGVSGTIEVQRGASNSPLYVSAAGMDPLNAAHHVEAMVGQYRIPTLLRRVDQLSRGIEP